MQFNVKFALNSLGSGLSKTSYVLDGWKYNIIDREWVIKLLCQ